jgi:hypothetical protein
VKRPHSSSIVLLACGCVGACGARGPVPGSSTPASTATAPSGSNDVTTVDSSSASSPFDEAAARAALEATSYKECGTTGTGSALVSWLESGVVKDVIVSWECSPKPDVRSVTVCVRDRLLQTTLAPFSDGKGSDADPSAPRGRSLSFGPFVLSGGGCR